MKRTFPAKTVCLAASLAALGGILAARPAAAQAPAVGFTANATAAEDTAANALKDPNGSYSLGFEFTANAPALVTSLGYFTDSASPFTQSHEVGLYQILPSGLSQLRASASVTSAGTPVGDFLYQSITPVALVTGGDYVLAGVTGPTDPYLFAVEDTSQPGNVGLTTNGITYVEDRFDPSATLTLPTQTDPNSTPGFFGPNLILAPVPEASTTLSLGLLLILGAVGLTVGRRSRHSR